MTQPDPKQTLRIGTRVFFPAHGVAIVIGVEEKAIGSHSQLFFALQLGGNDRVLLPVEKVEKAGVRDLVPVDRARRLLQQVTEEPSDDESSSRRARLAEYKESLRTGEADLYTSVLQRLLFRSRSHRLAVDEKRALREARGYFVSEMAAVLDVPQSEIENLLSKE